jgi:cell wall hydrolase
MPAKVRSRGRAQDGSRGRRAAWYRSLSAAGLALAVLAPAAPGSAATVHRLTTARGPKSAHPSELAAGARLVAGSSLWSPNGRYRLAMKVNGNLVLFWEGHPLWASGTAGHPGAVLAMQADGNLVIYHGKRPLWSSQTDRRPARYYLRLQNSGNAAIYSPAQKPVWATGTASGTGRSELMAGTELREGTWLSSPNGRYRLAVNRDGDLVLSREGHTVWASGTGKHPGAILAMKSNGNLVLYQGNRAIWSSRSYRGGQARYYLTVQDTGRATIYSTSRKPLWTTESDVVGLQLGDSGPAVKALQERLSALGYWVGTADGSFGDSTVQAVWALQKAAGIAADGVVGPQTAAALAAGTVPKPRSTSGYVVEVNLQDDLLMVVKDGTLLYTLNTSTGGGYTYVDQGVTSVATTPTGVFHIYRVIDGLDVDSLGALWRPRFFVGGFAIHGDSYVPPSPVSHGCVRVSDEAIDWIWSANIIPIGTEVWVY